MNTSLLDYIMSEVPIIFSSKNIYGIGCTGLEVRV